TWQTVAELGTAVEREYWRKVIVFIGSFNDAEAETLIGKRMTFGCGLLALEQAGLHPEKLAAATLVRVLEAALPELAQAKDIPNGVMLQYYLERIFQRLAVGSKVPDDVIAMLEWQY